MSFLSSWRSAWFMAFAQSVASLGGPAGAQQLPTADGGALDPASPLAPLPDLGVAWPDLATPDAAPPIAPGVKPVPAAGIDTRGEQRYRVVIEGIDEIDDPAFRTRFDGLSLLAQGESKPANAAQIDRRAREDADTLRELLRARGYYDAAVETRVGAAANDRLLVTLAAQPGALYRFSAVTLDGLGGAGPEQEALRAAFAVKADDPVDADRVLASQAALRSALGQRGFAFAKVGEPKVTIDHDAHRATLELAVEPNGARRFGKIELQGARLFSAKHIARIARFRPGDRYDATRLEDLRRALIATGLVSTVQLTTVPTADPNVVDVAVRLERAPPRTIAGEVGYGTGEGPRIEVSWQHRNLIKPEGAVTFRGVAGTQEQSLSALLRRNNYKARDRVLTAQIAATHSKREAYDAKTFTLAAGLERQTSIIWQKKWTWSYGVELSASDERDVVSSTGLPRRRTFLIGALPTSLAYDGSDDLLDPTRGYRLSGRLSPEVSLQSGAFGYARAQIDGSVYLPLSGRTTLAGRVRLGSIAGASRDRIAPSRRFYSGGGGSVRGYGYQDIGPRDVNNDPVGGRSLAEFSIETRIRFGESFGIVPFFDGGNLYPGALPDFTGLRYGAGIGARYYSSFGPIRVDVGTPINPRKGDARVAIYVSLGQAF